MKKSDAEKLFAYEHLPEGPVRMTSIKFYELAMSICGIIDGSAERTKCLNDLWSAKNWAVYAKVQQGRTGRKDG